MPPRILGAIFKFNKIKFFIGEVAERLKARPC